jgi:pyruvate/2-oxoglutarate/acetoin dehydrogenase E1 component
MDAAEALTHVGVDTEVIDVQSLLPFDRPGVVGASVKKTGRVIFLDEDVPGGVTAYMLQEVLERQGAYYWLDSAPRTLSAKDHRPAYASDGDHFSKPSVEDVFEAVYDMMHESDPSAYPMFYR